MRYNLLFGGAAGQGPNVITNLLGKALIKQGYFVFYSRDYQSVIRGGHNFNVLTFSDKPVNSNDSKYDFIICLDAKTKIIHSKQLKENGKIIEGNEGNIFFAGRIFKILGLDLKILVEELKEIPNYEQNVVQAKKGWESEEKIIEVKKLNPKKVEFMNGSEGISRGAIESGLDVYLAYPMTPATEVLTILAQKQKEKNFFVFEPENEIAVINAGVGSAMTGAKVMVGTSGGGFDLMTETLSLIGVAQIPLVIYLSQRPGPGTGVPTYTAQGDLQTARFAGHGEFNRVVLAGGDPFDAQELVSEAFYFAQKYKIPVIFLGDKHLAESYFTIERKPHIAKSKKSVKLRRYSSYETNEEGSSTEDPEIINKIIQKRKQVKIEIEKEAKMFSMFEEFGNKNSQYLIISWGSTKGVIKDATQGLKCQNFHLKYLEPFPEKIKELIKKKKIIVIENNATGLLCELIAQKTGRIINENEKILRYDGRPFLADELNSEIKKRIK